MIRDVNRLLKEHCRNTPLWITGAGCATEDYDEFSQCETLMGLLDTETQRVYWSRLQDALPSRRRSSPLSNPSVRPSRPGFWGS